MKIPLRSLNTIYRLKKFFVLFISLFLFLSTSAIALAAASWTNVGNLVADHENHVAVILANGKVLAIGGTFNNNPTNKTELYNPATGTWGASPVNMNQCRNFATAHTVLVSGIQKVLAIGGSTCSGYTNTTELYSTSSATWSLAASMSEKRALHASIEFNNGTVFVIGGDKGFGVATPSSELYDPSTNSWTTKASMSVARKSHTATLMQDGRVLVVGGVSTSSAVATTEIYDPSNNTWTNGPTMTYARVAHSAILLPDGRVLIVGGFSISASTTAEIYDPNTNSFTLTSTPNYTHNMSTATLVTLSGGSTNVLVARSTVVTDKNKAELYDYNNDTWTTTTNLNTGRSNHTATLLNDGTVLVVGGYNSAGAGSKTAEYYTAP